MNAFHVFAHEDEGNMGDTSAERARITIAADLSLDEGAILRTVAGSSPLSSGTEYFVGFQRDEATIVLDALEALREAHSLVDLDHDYGADDIDAVKRRVERLLGYINVDHSKRV
jgi:hypothetical protein